ncbi:MAG: methylated-DNA--[protein]-cysteine S-methyltransferase, partial [Candidatus Velthaea sp.]
MKLRSDVLASPVGDVLIVCTEQALCAVDFGGYDARMHAFLRRRFDNYTLERWDDPLGSTSMLRRYFAGDVAAIDTVAVEGGGSPYQERVWSALRTIPHGRTRTYGQLAMQVGGTVARAIGYANSQNPIAIVVPCHRVVR